MSKYLIDTDIIIDYLRGVPPSTHFLEKTIVNAACYLSSITVAELYAGIREGKERHLFENFLQAFEIVPINTEIAQLGGLFRRDYHKRFGVGLADALIAASAHTMVAQLVTLNKKHFPMLKNILVPYKKS
jgi:predicted nucleic acid-binding protein